MRRLPNPASLSVQDRHSYRIAFLGPRYDNIEQMEDGSLIATYDDASRGSYYLAIFAGTALKPRAAYCYCRTIVRRQELIEQFKRSREAAAEAKAARRQERNQPHTLQVGDILYSSWGYEQTNIDYYQVVAVRGKVVDLQEVAQQTAATSDMTGTCTPIRDKFIGEVLKSKRPNARNSVRIASYASACPWDGRPLHWTSYA